MSLPADVSIRRAGPADAEALSELHLDCWDDAYAGLVPQEILAERRMRILERIDHWRGALERGDVVWVAEREGTLSGFAEARPADDPELAGLLELRVLYVRAPWWGTTVGHHLFRRAVGDEPSYLCVLEGNTRAIGFYERQGYRADGFTEDVPEGRHVRMLRQSPATAGMQDDSGRFPTT
jgi:GNAT superfamily N-acetyltransferase